MSLELVPVYPGRPVVVTLNGLTHYVSIHDTGYLEHKRTFRRELFRLHPDRRPRSGRKLFQEKMVQFRTWLRKERAYYWSLGLMPPDWRGPLREPEEFLKPCYRLSPPTQELAP